MERRPRACLILFFRMVNNFENTRVKPECLQSRLVDVHCVNRAAVDLYSIDKVGGLRGRAAIALG